MKVSTRNILSVLDACCDTFTFPMLDNGYVYLAATRLTAFRSKDNWALTIEVFGYSPKVGCPDLHISTFGGTLKNRKQPRDYVSREAYERYLAQNPHYESRFVYPVAHGKWVDGQFIAKDVDSITLRGHLFPLPLPSEYKNHGVELQDKRRARAFEFCRLLAGAHRTEVLATAEELRVNVPREMKQALQLNEWHHPDVADDACRPSGSEAFRQLAEVIVTGNADTYRPTLPPNTHWRNWPAGGTLC